ncbi:hypothetical protein JTE90_009237 [Oedothorax gibbosus]|uniref:Cyclin-dependent kinase inhibitor domain-containing protein n=1 Tax=Oedothorax gibbosus TaxID=931172 RepID=A0AAV6URL9_9ARAC|nr:hypothetical protein JTE90_009237 [Oedothorax gibbosus]
MGDVAAVGVLRNNTSSGPGWNVGPQRSAGARRCLFGPPDPEKTREFLQSETERIADENKLKWNFDFVAEEPLDCGRFAWSKVSETDDQKDDNKVQTRITDFMRKRKLPSHHPKDEPTSSERPKKEPKSSEDESTSSEEPPTKCMRRFST